MHARVIRATVGQGGIDEGMEGIQAVTVPAVKQLPGNRGGYWFANRESGEVTGTIFFEDQAALDSSRDAAARLREETMARTGAQFTSVDEYEVIATTGEKVSTSAKFGRLTFIEGDASMVDTARDQFLNQVIPALAAIGGFAGAVSLADRASGKGIAISLWDSEEALKASAAAASAVRSSATQAAQQTVISVHEGEIGARAETD